MLAQTQILQNLPQSQHERISRLIFFRSRNRPEGLVQPGKSLYCSLSARHHKEYAAELQCFGLHTFFSLVKLHEASLTSVSVSSSRFASSMIGTLHRHPTNPQHRSSIGGNRSPKCARQCTSRDAAHCPPRHAWGDNQLGKPIKHVARFARVSEKKEPHHFLGTMLES